MKQAVNQSKSTHTPTLRLLVPSLITHPLPHPTLMNMRHSRLQIRVTHSPSTVTEISAALLARLPSFTTTKTAAPTRRWQPSSPIWFCLRAQMASYTCRHTLKSSHGGLICIYSHVQRRVYAPSVHSGDERKWEVAQEGHWDTSSSSAQRMRGSGEEMA